MEVLRNFREETTTVNVETAAHPGREYNEVKSQQDSTLTQVRELRMTRTQSFKKGFRAVMSSLKRERLRIPLFLPYPRAPRHRPQDRATV